MGLIDRKEKIPPMRSKEESNALKEEVETVSRKLHELTEEELAQVSGGETIVCWDAMCSACGETIGGAGSGCYTHKAMEDKIKTYNPQGCPGCGKKGMMVEYSFTVEF